MTGDEPDRSVSDEQAQKQTTMASQRTRWAAIVRQGLRAGLATFVIGLTMVSKSAWAGPYLHRAIEYSNARSKGECESFAAKAMRSVNSRLKSFHKLQIDQSNNRLGSTKNTTIYVECIFVAKNEQNRNQWIYYISAASTDLGESRLLRSRLQASLRKIAPID